MSDTWRTISANLASFVAPGLVLLLLGIQIAFGLRGFDKPDESLLYVLQVPGVLLGWGGVAMLLPLLAWMVLDWWGYDLNGFALKGLGSAVLGIAVAGLVGLSGGVEAGGLVGAGLANVLSSTVGTFLAWIVLLLMALPAAVLALSLQRGAPRPQAAAPKAASKDAPKAAPKAASKAAPKEASKDAPEQKRATPPRATSPAARTPRTATSSAAATGRVQGGRRKRSLFARVGDRLLGRGRNPNEDEAWYPKQRFDALGNELPMDFGKARDVGGIRFADEGEAEAPTAQADVHHAPMAQAAMAQAPMDHAEKRDLDHAEKPDPLAALDPRAALDQPDAEPQPESPRAADPAGQGEKAGQDAPEPAGPAAVIAGEERLPTIPELLAGNFSDSSGGGRPRLRGGPDPSGGPRELAGAQPDDGPVHVDGEGRPMRSPQTAARAMEAPGARAVRPDAPSDVASDVRTHADPSTDTPPLPFLDPPFVGRTQTSNEPTLLPGVRYADEPEQSTDTAQTDGSGTTEPEPVEAQLSQAIQDAVRGPVPTDDQGVGAASARAIRKSLRKSVASLQTDPASDRHLKKLEAMGLFDMLEEPATEEPTSSGGGSSGSGSSGGGSSGGGSSGSDSSGSGSSGSGSSGGATATASRSKAGKRTASKRKSTPKAAPKTPATKKAAAKKASAKKASRKKTARKKAGTRTASAKGSRKKAAGQRSVPPGKASGKPRQEPQARARPARQTSGGRDSAAQQKARRTRLLEGLRVERLDPLFRRSVEAALERGVATPVLLTRRLGLPFARAEALIERMISAGVLDETNQTGSHATLISRREWDSLG